MRWTLLFWVEVFLLNLCGDRNCGLLELIKKHVSLDLPYWFYHTFLEVLLIWISYLSDKAHSMATPLRRHVIGGSDFWWTKINLYLVGCNFVNGKSPSNFLPRTNLLPPETNDSRSPHSPRRGTVVRTIRPRSRSKAPVRGEAINPKKVSTSNNERY